MQSASNEKDQTPKSDEVKYDQLLEYIGFGRTQWLLLLITGLLTLTSISSQIAMGIMAISSQCEFQTTQRQKGVLMVAGVAGIGLSTYIWGYISDAFGRRFVMLYSTFSANLLQVILMFVTNIWLFNCINFAVGISLGGITAAKYAYLIEFNIPRYRAVVINYSAMFVSVAAVYVPAMAWLVLEFDWSLHIVDDFEFRPWRLLILVCLAPGLIGALMLLRFPESPKLLLAQNKISEATRAVEWICRENTGRSVTSLLDLPQYSLRPEPLEEKKIGLNSQNSFGFLVSIWRDTMPLFHKPHVRNFLLSAAAIFGMFFSYAGMQLWFSEIVNRSSSFSVTDTGLTVCGILDSSFQKQMANINSTHSTVCDDSISTKTFVDNMIVGLAVVGGFVLQGVLLQPLGKKRVILGALAISVLSGIQLHFVSNPTMVFIFFCLYILMPILTISVVFGAVVELVPTNLRGKAVSCCFTVGRLAIIFSTNLIGILLEPACNATFAVFTTSMIVCAILVKMMPI